jgi:hypothetical protein
MSTKLPELQTNYKGIPCRHINHLTIGTSTGTQMYGKPMQLIVKGLTMTAQKHLHNQKFWKMDKNQLFKYS